MCKVIRLFFACAFCSCQLTVVISLPPHSCALLNHQPPSASPRSSLLASFQRGHADKRVWTPFPQCSSGRHKFWSNAVAARPGPYTHTVNSLLPTLRSSSLVGSPPPHPRSCRPTAEVFAALLIPSCHKIKPQITVLLMRVRFGPLDVTHHLPTVLLFERTTKWAESNRPCEESDEVGVRQLSPAPGPNSLPRKSRDSSRARTLITSMVEPEARDSDRPSRRSRPKPSSKRPPISVPHFSPDPRSSTRHPVLERHP